jgi:methionyl-tRNA synthetase
MTPERETYLRSKTHTGTETHTMEFKACEACELGEAFKEVDRLRGEADIKDSVSRQERTDYFIQIEQLREKLSVAVEALEEICQYGNKAHSDGTSTSHSLHLGLSVGVAFRTLSEIKGENG